MCVSSRLLTLTKFSLSNYSLALWTRNYVWKVCTMFLIKPWMLKAQWFISNPVQLLMDLTVRTNSMKSVSVTVWIYTVCLLCLPYFSAQAFTKAVWMLCCVCLTFNQPKCMSQRNSVRGLPVSDLLFLNSVRNSKALGKLSGDSWLPTPLCWTSTVSNFWIRVEMLLGLPTGRSASSTLMSKRTHKQIVQQLRDLQLPPQLPIAAFVSCSETIILNLMQFNCFSVSSQMWNNML